MNKNEPLKLNKHGYLELDEYDHFQVSKKPISDIEKFIYLMDLRAVILTLTYEELSAQDLDITISSERGYLCAEFCGGVYEVSLRTDLGAGCYEASVGNELVMFSTLNDAVDSFFECIEEAVKEQIRNQIIKSFNDTFPKGAIIRRIT